MRVITVNEENEWTYIGYTQYTTQNESMTFQKQPIIQDRQRNGQEFEEWKTFFIRNCETEDGDERMVSVMSMEEAFEFLPNFKLRFDYEG